MASDTVHVDGSHGEGGGQIVRTSLALSAITGRPVEITDVRARRSKPGLQPQHLAAVRAAADICRAKVTGDDQGSTHLRFIPRSDVRAGNYRFDIGTAGSATLVCQTVLVPLALADAASHVVVTGGTHQPLAPTIDYLEEVYVPAIRRAGYEVRVSWETAGFYPRGGGLVQAWTRPSEPRPVDLATRGAMRSQRAIVVTSNLPDHVSKRGAATARERLGHDVAVEIRNPESPGSGAAVTAVATYEAGWGGFSGIGRPGKPMEKVAEEACRPLLVWKASAAACDEHLGDQLVLPLSFARGTSTWTLPQPTTHLETVAWVAQRFLPVDARISDGEPATVSLRA